jgi:hypothetical protein
MSFRQVLTAAALVVVGVVLVGQVRKLLADPTIWPPDDFIEYWAAAKLTLEGGNPYDGEQLLPLQRAGGRDTDKAVMMWNPPWTLAAVLPLGLLPAREAQLLWLLVNFAAVLFCGDRLWLLRGGSRDRRWVGWAVALAALPTAFALQSGQIGPLLLLGAVLFLECERRGWHYAAGAATVLLAVKPHLAYLVWVAILCDALTRGRWRILIGGAVAGLVGGLIYGFAGASQSQAGVGALSVLLVLVVVTMAVGLVGGAGVGFGIAAAGYAPDRQFPWSGLGGAAGGLLVGAVVKLVGMDAFTLLVGRSPGDITGAPEGVLLGAAVGLGAWLAFRGANPPSPRRGFAMAALTTGIAGAVIPLLGGRLLLGSLDSLARQFPDSRLRLIGGLFGDSGTAVEAALGLLEGGLFGGCVIAAIIAVRRGFGAEPRLSRDDLILRSGPARRPRSWSIPRR